MPLPALPILSAALGGAVWIVRHFLTYFSKLIFSRGGAWVAAGATFLGVQLVVGNVLLEQAVEQVRSMATGVTGDIAAWLGILRVDDYITIVLSAYTAAIAKRVVLQRRAS